MLPDALALADAVLIGPVNRAQLLGKRNGYRRRQSRTPSKSAGGRPKRLQGTEEIVEYLSEHARPRDVVMIMSNGSFDGLSGRLLAALKTQEVGRR